MADKVIYLTYDMEWSCDELMDWFIDNAVNKQGIKGTINVTHNTRCLEQIRSEKKLELGIHPNFNNLLESNNFLGDDYRSIVCGLKQIVPEAVSIRSHSLVKSNQLSKFLSESGFKVESNIFVEPYEGISITSFKDCFGLIQVPILFEDDLYLSSTVKHHPEWYFDIDMDMVFNFHPIHLLLNTDNMDRYSGAKPYYHDFVRLQDYINRDQYGVYDFYKDLISIGKLDGYEFRMLREISAV